jgi:NADPH-dependent 2,4-dienoyl-CoA reductase/sulfur reductase-like enzyme
LWLKGATSGNIQEVVDLASIVMAMHCWFGCARQDRPAIPVRRVVSISHWMLGRFCMTIDELFQIIHDRKEHPVDGSYTNYLFEKGEDEILKKVGEEAMEIILAAKSQGNQPPGV